MALGMSATLADACLSLQVDVYVNIQLHTADPGAAGTTAVAVNNVRKAVTWSAPAAITGAREITSTAEVSWVNVPASEDYTHFSMFDGSATPVFGFSGTVTANAVVAGDTFTIAAGNLDASFPIAA